jgi:hypothetical protein
MSYVSLDTVVHKFDASDALLALDSGAFIRVPVRHLPAQVAEGHRLSIKILPESSKNQEYEFTAKALLKELLN